MDLKIKVSDPKLKPERQHSTDAGLDLKTATGFTIPPERQITVSTGVSVAIPVGFVGLVMIRSGVAKNHGLTLINGVGVIDSEYRGEIHLPLINSGFTTASIGRGDRIAQLLIVPVELPDIVLVDELDETERGSDGLGSTGK
jgi:dUTP pyrophosphatase